MSTIIVGKTCTGGEDVIIVLAKPCSSHEKNHGYCGRCDGTGMELTDAGKTLIDFVRTYGHFADDDHWHSASEEL